MPRPIAASGAWGTVEWAVDARGNSTARDFYTQLSDADKAKVNALFKSLAENGRIPNREKFRNLGAQAGRRARGLWEFKSFQIRFLGDFRPGRRFVVAHGCRKKQDQLSRSDIERAMRILDEDTARKGL